MKAKKLEPYEKPEKTRMYEFDYSRDVVVKEEGRDDGTYDVTTVHFFVGSDEKAYFSKEYRPESVSEVNTKKPDITAMIENQNAKKLKWYIYDMKGTVIHAKTALSLCNQWHYGIEHITSEYLAGLENYDIVGSVGFITRYWDKERLTKEIVDCQNKIDDEESSQLLTARKSCPDIWKYKERIRAIQYIIAGVFEDVDETTGESYKYDISVIDLVDQNGIVYAAEFEVRL